MRLLTWRAGAQTFPNGGCWILKVRNKSGAVSQLWQDLVFAAIGEVFEEPGLVGVVLAMRSRDSYLAVWHADNATTRTRFLIGCAPDPALRPGAAPEPGPHAAARPCPQRAAQVRAPAGAVHGD